MMLIVRSEADPASRSITDQLRALAPWEPVGTHDGKPAYRAGDLALLAIGAMHLETDNVDRLAAEVFGESPDTVAFASRHRSGAGRDALTVHPIGNYADAAYGGRPGTLVPAAANRMTSALRALKRHAAGLPYDVTFEVTHHGPYLETPTFYIEVGSSEASWADSNAAAAVARALLDTRDEGLPVAVGVGGGHYAPRFTELALARSIAFGHMVPVHALEAAGDDALAWAVRATPGASLAYLHRKSMPKDTMRRLEGRAAALGLRNVRERDLPPHP